MELKLIFTPNKVSCSPVIIVPLWNWNGVSFANNNNLESYNRTFMELKFGGETVTGTAENVIIVPLWNWNEHDTNISILFLSYNRTFMELKSESVGN